MKNFLLLQLTKIGSMVHVDKDKVHESLPYEQPILVSADHIIVIKDETKYVDHVSITVANGHYSETFDIKESFKHVQGMLYACAHVYSHKKDEEEEE